MRDPVIKVGLVDSHEVVRKGLGALLTDFDDIEVVGHGNCPQSARYVCDTHKPHVLITDFLKEGQVGLRLLSKLQQEFPDTKLLLLTNVNSRQMLNEAMQLGVLGYWFKTASLTDIVGAIRKVSNNQPSLDPDALRLLIQTITAPPQIGHDLTDREREVLFHMAKGYSNREIARKLVISYSTVKNHVSQVLSKLGVSNRVEATTLALENGLVEPAAAV